MANFLNFVKVEGTGNNRKEAEANLPFEVIGDATVAFTKWKNNLEHNPSDGEIREWMGTYLDEKGKNVPGCGFAITIERAVPDTRERPYEVRDKGNELGKRKYARIYQLIDNETNAILGEVEGTKADAKNLSKELIRQGYHGEGRCIYIRRVVEGEPVAFTFKYAPSKGAKMGRWMFFGIVE